jgi:predicted ATPase
MLTRIEIDGFKSFENFELDLPPFLVILGANSVGKSNLFDALKLLADLARGGVGSAFSQNRGDPLELFRRNSAGEPVERMKFAVDVLLPTTISDSWGEPRVLSQTRLRYEIVLRRIRTDIGIQKVVIEKESATAIRKADDSRFLQLLKEIGGPSAVSRTKYAAGRKTPYLQTENGTIKISQDTRQGRDRSIKGEYTASVLSSISDNDFPHLYALQQELASIRFLQLDASAMRPNLPMSGNVDVLDSSGKNLAAILFRLKSETATTSSPLGILVDIGTQLSKLIPSVASVDVEEDRAAGEYKLSFEFKGEAVMSSRVASEGTLRVLALLTLIEDAKSRGTVCFEEPENGLHPERLRLLVTMLVEVIRENLQCEDPESPLLQLICNSHSPVVLGALGTDRDRFGVFFDASRAGGKGRAKISEQTRARRISNSMYDKIFEQEGTIPVVSPGEVKRYLESSLETVE